MDLNSPGSQEDLVSNWEPARSLFVWVLFCFLSLSFSLAIPQFRLLSHISSLRLPSGHSGLVLTLSNAARASLISPHLLVADARVWATSPLGVAIRHVICGVYLLFFLPVMLPSEIPKLPTDPLVRGLPDVWKLLFYDSLHGTDLHL